MHNIEQYVNLLSLSLVLNINLIPQHITFNVKLFMYYSSVLYRGHESRVNSL